MLGKQLQTAAAGSGAAEGEYIEDLFSTYTYDGTGNAQTIANGIDLAGEGGLVWLKQRNSTGEHVFTDTIRGANNLLYSSSNVGENNGTWGVNSFGSAGFGVIGSDGYNNTSTGTYTSWTFRKAPGFFDVVTWVGDGTNSRGINHALGATPGCVIVKRTDSTSDWSVVHRGYLFNAINGYTGGKLNSTVAFGTTTSDDTGISYSSTQILVSDSVGSNFSSVNANGATYVAYIFAHDQAIFGEKADQSVIKCGSYTGTGSAVTVNLGWEPQFVIIKSATNAQYWGIWDNMRGVATANSTAANSGGTDYRLYANANTAEQGSHQFDNYVDFTSTGFIADPTSQTYFSVNDTNKKYVYIAIRRGPMKIPTDATKVFSAIARSGNQSTYDINVGFAPDSVWCKHRSGTVTASHLWFDRPRGIHYKLSSDLSSAESNYSPDYLPEFGSTGYTMSSGYYINYNSNTYLDLVLRRAPSFFDIVCYTGTGVARTVNHNLGVEPEMIIVKRRDTTGNWQVYHTGLTSAAYKVNLDSSTGESVLDNWNSTDPTSSVFSLGGAGGVNTNNGTYIAYLFATCPGVSKVGSYTGTGSNINVNCGFTAGARFVLIKRIDNTGDWYYWDTSRGIVSGNDPYLRFNDSGVEVGTTDYIDPYALGFTVTSTAPTALNASGGKYLFLAIA